jgi:hypothetical protein
MQQQIVYNVLLVDREFPLIYTIEPES